MTFGAKIVLEDRNCNMAVNSHFTVLLIPVFVSECLNVISVPIYVDTEKRGGTQGWREKREQGAVNGQW